MGIFVYGNTLKTFAKYFRVIELAGRFGGGKTLSAFALAQEMCLTMGYRYILSNVNSVWTDNPEKVVLRDNQFVDAVVILDEGGLFLKYGNDAEKFLAGLRKLNVAILVPTFIPPSSKIQFVTVQRLINFAFLGVPYWHCQVDLRMGRQKDTAQFGIFQPKKMWGIYDTLDYPTDDAYLSGWLAYWIEHVQAQKPKWIDWGPPPGYKGDKLGNKRSREDTSMAEAGRDLEDIIRKQTQSLEALSLFDDKRSRKKI